MLNYVKNKVSKSKVKLNPYPHIVIKNFFPKKIHKELVNLLPDFNQLSNSSDKKILLQGNSKTKKTIMPDTQTFKILNKDEIFKRCNDVLQKIKPVLLKKFNNIIEENIHTKYLRSKIKYHVSVSLMKKSYSKRPHIDRRDHLIHGLYYPVTDKSQGGNLLLYSLKKLTKTFDIFPKTKDLKVQKKITIDENICIFSLNVPWAYHGVDRYYGKKDRKYFYIAYDFLIRNPGNKLINRKKGFNDNKFWIKPARVKSQIRRKIFLIE